MTVKCTNDD